MKVVHLPRRDIVREKRDDRRDIVRKARRQRNEIGIWTMALRGPRTKGKNTQRNRCYPHVGGPTSQQKPRIRQHTCRTSVGTSVDLVR